MKGLIIDGGSNFGAYIYFLKGYFNKDYPNLINNLYQAHALSLGIGDLMKDKNIFTNLLEKK